MENIVLGKIPQRRIRTFIKNQIENNIICINDLKASHVKGDSLENHSKHEAKFLAKHSIDKVWKFYIRTDPSKIWKGRLVSFGLMLSKSDNQIMYVDDPYERAKVGQVYFMNLKILRGLYQLAVSHEIIDINTEKKYIDLSYIEGGKSIGLQRIALHQKGEFETSIIHTTFYKSNSKFRDKFIYPYFHSKVLKEYHSNVINQMSG